MTATGTPTTALGATSAAGAASTTAAPPFVPLRRGAPPAPPVTLTIDGHAVTVSADTTILGACAELGIALPTLCWLQTLKPVNACRLCVVEVEGARVLAPGCSRLVEEGMVVRTASPRVRHSRKLVLELLASSVDLSTTPGMAELLAEYGCDPERYGPPAPPAPEGARDAAVAGHHAPPDPRFRATVAQPVKLDNELYVRDYAKCVLCYKCVEACGPDHQNTFAIAVAGRGFDARISTELAVPLPGSACVYCGNCIAVCPTGALMARSEWEMRQAGTWDESRQSATSTICPYCGVGCTLTLHVQDGGIVKATSPLDNGITLGNLCIKGRFGWRFVQGTASAAAGAPASSPVPPSVSTSTDGADRRLGYGPPARARRVARLEGDRLHDATVTVAEEVPAALVYAGRSHVVMMCTPADLEDLAVGFTVTEGIVDAPADVGAVCVARHSRGVELEVEIPADAATRLRERARLLAGRTGCGLCGVEAIDDAVRPVRLVRTTFGVAPAALWRAAAALDAHQPLNAETRAVHAAAWCDPDGTVRVAREDVGRHNALDKVVGALLRAGLDPATGFVVVTSRASFELVQKAAAAGVPLLAAVSRPTGLAVRLAEQAGMTLVALLRGETADVHANGERIVT